MWSPKTVLAKGDSTDFLGRTSGTLLAAIPKGFWYRARRRGLEYAPLKLTLLIQAIFGAMRAAGK
jgi:hypothetical protein